MINNMKGDMQERLVYARRLIGCRRDLRLEISHGTHGRTRKDKTREILIKRCRMAKRLRSQHVISMGTACLPLPILRSAARRVRVTHQALKPDNTNGARSAPYAYCLGEKKGRVAAAFLSNCVKQIRTCRNTPRRSSSGPSRWHRAHQTLWHLGKVYLGMRLMNRPSR